MRRSIFFLLALTIVGLPLDASSQSCWPNSGTWPHCYSDSSVSYLLNQQRQQQRYEEERQRLENERYESERENRRLRALDARRRNQRWRDSGSGLYIPHRSR